MNRDFAEMLAALSNAKADFILVGAHALAAHGVVRATGDLDIWVRPTAANAVFDAEKQLLAFHNFRNAFPVCGTPVTEISFFSLQEVLHGNADELINQLATNDHTYISVWHSTNGSIFDARCTTPIATGVGSIVNTDNDVFSFLHDRLNANAFGFTAHGTLTGADGAVYQYSGVSKFKWQPNNPTGDQRFEEIASINLVRVSN